MELHYGHDCRSRSRHQAFECERSVAAASAWSPTVIDKYGLGAPVATFLHDVPERTREGDVVRSEEDGEE